MSDKLNIALAGNPNCGKTTLFNELTGSNGYVGNSALGPLSLSPDRRLLLPPPVPCS